MPSFRNKVELEDVHIVKDSGKALLCDIDGKQVWIPQSQIDDDSEIWSEGDTGKLVVSDWIAAEKGLV